MDGQLCYKADLDRLRDKVDKKKMVEEGFVFMLDYNEDRMVEVVGAEDNNGYSSFLREDAMIHVQTVGKTYELR